MFQEIQNWQPDGTAEDLRCALLKEPKEGKAVIAVKRQNMGLLTHSCTSKRWALVVLGSILLLSFHLPHACGGETKLEEYYKTLKGLDKNMQEVKQKYKISGIIAGIDAQVEVKPKQEPFVGGGTRMSRGNTAKYCGLESKFESLLMAWITKNEIKLANTFCRKWEPTRARTNKLDFWKQEEEQLQKWKIIHNIAVPIHWWARSAVARDCRAQNLTDHWPVVTKVRLPQKSESWKSQNNSILKGWRPKTESDEAGFGKLFVEIGRSSLKTSRRIYRRQRRQLNLCQKEGTRRLKKHMNILKMERT